MKNIFNYATKELSQDAFLRWLFESFEDIDILPCVRSILETFCELNKDEEIQEVKTVAQWNDIDISVYIKTNLRDLELYIEDKVYSLEHDNQLLKYNKFINEGENIYKVYYKTSLLGSNEINATDHSGWKAYDINAICELFTPFENTTNVILRQYIEHIEQVCLSLSNIDLPKDNATKEDKLRWESYFRNIIIPRMNDILPNKIDWIVGTYQGIYVYLQGFIKGKEHSPFIEIRSRDCCFNNSLNANDFTARILCYGVEDFTPQAKVIEQIKRDNILDCKGLLKNKPKQIGKSPLNIAVKDDNDFIYELNRYTEYYLSLMDVWYQK